MEQRQLYDRERLLQQLGASRKPQDSTEGDGQGKDPQEEREPKNPYLQGKEQQKRQADVYLEYQNNIKLCDNLKVKILKGIMDGTDVYTLLYWALDAVSKTTHDSHFLDQAWSDVNIIRGWGLGEPGPLAHEIGAARDRLERITAAYNRETDTRARSRMQAAIRAHEQLITRLEGRAG